jgi:ankyrin repeat protein
MYLIDKLRLDPNYIDGYYRTALQAACTVGNFLVVKLLLENGADVTVANNNRLTPLNSASNNGHAEMVKLLLEKGADVTVTRRSTNLYHA